MMVDGGWAGGREAVGLVKAVSFGRCGTRTFAGWFWLARTLAVCKSWPVTEPSP